MADNLPQIKPISGILNIDKAPGMTSHDVVGRVRRILREGGWGKSVKVGHAGTLDPDATGVLLVCLGGATRLADLLAGQGKVYRAEFRLGATTTTEDASGEVTGEWDASPIMRGDVVGVLESLTGTIEQIPPMVSAVHHEGRRLYELARQGIEVERAARTIVVDKIELLRFEGGVSRPEGEMRVACGKGTYVRTLCADLGARLGVGGHMTVLRRLKVGTFDAEDALPVDALSGDAVQAHMISASQAVSFLPLCDLTEGEFEDVLHGRAIYRDDHAELWHGAEWVRLVNSAGELVALAVPGESGLLYPKKVLTSG